jgi:hypothetical protein
MIFIGIIMIFFTFSIEFGILPKVSVVFFGIALIVIGSLFLLLNRRNKPALPPEAKVLLKEVNRR